MDDPELIDHHVARLSAWRHGDAELELVIAEMVGARQAARLSGAGCAEIERRHREQMHTTNDGVPGMVLSALFDGVLLSTGEVAAHQ